jgi:Ser/Thr protein kinase RdoA (MazF antagonist)
MADVPGIDCWEPDAATVREVLRRYVAVQVALAGRELPGLPDHRVSTLARRVERLLAAAAAGALDAAERHSLDRLVEDLPRRAAAIAAAGLPETLVHGDFHPGNWRSDGQAEFAAGSLSRARANGNRRRRAPPKRAECRYRPAGS